MSLDIDTPVEILPLRYHYPNMPGGYEPVNGIITGVQRRWWGARYQVAYLGQIWGDPRIGRVYGWYKRKDLVELYDA